MPIEPPRADRPPDLLLQILSAMEAAGLDLGRLTYKDLLSLDQLQIGGVAHTRAMAMTAGITENDRVLDIGCGIGGAARVIASEFGADVLAIDRSETYINTARALTSMALLDQSVAFEVQSAPGLTLPNESCDVVWLQLVLMNIESKAALYTEISELLRPGGRLALFDVVADRSEPEISYPVIWAEDKADSHIVTVEQHRSMLSAAGFTDIEISDYTPVALDWYDQVRWERSESHPPLSTGLLISGDAGLKSRHVQQALQDGQLKAIQLLARSSR